MLQQRPNTFAQTNLSLSFFACDKAADHTFRIALHSEQSRKPAIVGWPRIYCSFAYSAFASFRIGMSGSASFQRARKSW